MLNISTVSQPGGATVYYTKDNFYSNEQKIGPSEWYGKGAEYLGLIGDNKLDGDYNFSKEAKIDPDTFYKLLLGDINPDNKLRDINKIHDGKQIAAHDITFNTPKSVSLVALLGKDDRIIQATKEAVKETVDYAEKNYAGVFVNRKDNVGVQKTGNLTVGLITHNTNRAGEPHLHIHAVNFNQTYVASEDKWKSLNNSALFKNKYELTFIFHKILENKINDLGIATVRSKDGLFEIKGISREFINEFSSRRKDILSEVSEGASYQEKSNAALNTRDPKLQISNDELSDKWANDLEKSQHKKELNNLHEHKELKSAKSVSVAFKAAIRDLEAKSNTFTQKEILQLTQNFTSIGINPANIQDKIERHTKFSNLIRHEGKSTPHDVITFTTPRNIQYEVELINNVTSTQNKQAPLIEPDKVTAALSKYAPELVKSQATGAEFILTNKDKYVGLIGRPGSGKTFTLGKIVNTINEPRHKADKINIINLAPSITATEELKSATKGEGRTLQWFTQKYQNYDQAKLTKEEASKFKNSIILLDESSLISNEDFVKFERIVEKFGIQKAVIIGDTQQNGALKAGSPLTVQIENGLNYTKLSENIRQKNENLYNAANALNQKSFKEAWSLYEEHVVVSDSFIKNAAKDYASQYKESPDTIIVTLDNRTRENLNEEVQAIYVENNKTQKTEINVTGLKAEHITDQASAFITSYSEGQVLEFNKDIYKSQIKKNEFWTIKSVNQETNQIIISKEGKKDFTWTVQKTSRKLPFELYSNQDRKFYAKDRIVFRNTDSNHKVSRGLSATIIKTSNNSLIIKSSDGITKTISINDRAAKFIELDYAITSYNSQGKSKDHEIAVIDSKSGALGYESVNVELTREKLSLSIHTDDWNTATLKAEKSRIDAPAINFDEKSKQIRLIDKLFQKKANFIKQTENLEIEKIDKKYDHQKLLDKLSASKQTHKEFNEINNAPEKQKQIAKKSNQQELS